MKRQNSRTAKPKVWAVLLVWVSLVSCAVGQSTTLIVTNLNDDGPGSLRETIAAAPPQALITFAVSGTITLTSSKMLITNDLTITGPGQASLTISGNTNSRIFEIGSQATVTISDLTISGGHAPD